MSTLELATIEPFQSLSADALRALQPQLQLRRCRIGQVLQHHDQPSNGMALVLRGQLRCLGQDPFQNGLRSLCRCGPGQIVGWFGVLSGQLGEQIQVSSSEAEILWIPATVLQQLWIDHPHVLRWFEQKLSPIELYLLLLSQLQLNLAWRSWLEQWLQLLECAQLQLADQPSPAADGWVVLPSPWRAQARWIAVPLPDGVAVSPPGESERSAELDQQDPGFYALAPSMAAPGSAAPLSIPGAVGPRLAPLAICEGIAEQFQVPCDREALLDQIDAFLQQQQRLNLVNVGQLLSSMGLRVMLVQLPLDRLPRVQPPAVLLQDNQLGVLDGVDPDGSAR
ncbi:MAG: hypothetical protein ACO3FN_11780, partial [Vulcanococcus sp.]